MNLKNLLSALILGCSFVSASSNASVAHFVLNATPGDWVSGGHQIDNIYSSADPLLIWNSATFSNIGTATTPSTDYISFTFLLNPSLVVVDEYAQLSFATNALGIPLTTGSYLDAERAPFASAGHPGLEINYDHRGCNTLTGSFTVNDLTFSGGGINSFSSSFSQSCDGGALMSGTFNYYADRTTLATVPEPATIALLALGALMLAAVFGRSGYKAAN